MCRKNFFGQLLCNQRFNPGIEGNLLHFGARRESSPSGQLVQFIKFGVNRLAQRFPAFCEPSGRKGCNRVAAMRTASKHRPKMPANSSRRLSSLAIRNGSVSLMKASTLGPG